MSDMKEASLGGVISNLDENSEEVDVRLYASSPEGLDDAKEDQKQDYETGTRALEDYLTSRLQQIGEVAPEKREIKGLKTGNGWDTNQIMEQTFKIEPVSMKRAVEVALSSNRSLKEHISNILRRRKPDLTLVGEPTVEFVLIWAIKGFHECYYTRTSSYRVNVKDDVVAVEVEGKSRDMILERRHSRLIPAVIVERFQKLSSFLSNESKYFVVSDVLELATKRSESELIISGGGRPLTEDEEMSLTSWRFKRIFDLSDLKVRGARTRVRESIISKETLLNRFRERVIQMPERFKQILSNKLQISELKRIYVPFIRIPMQKGLVPREIIVNGTTGELADAKLLELLE